MSKDETKGILSASNGESVVSKIKKHKLLIVVFLFASFILSIGIFGAIALQGVWKASLSFATTDIPAISSMYTMEEMLTKETVYINRLIPITEKEKKTIDINTELINENNKDLNNIFSNLEKIIINEEEKNALKEAKERFDLLSNKSSEFSTKIKEGDIYSAETNSLLLSMESLSLQTQEGLFNLSHMINKRVYENSLVLSDKQAFMRRNIIFLLISGLFAAALAGLFIGKHSVLKPIINTEEHVKELAELNEELNRSNKLLVQRDSSLSEVNERLLQQDTVRSEFVSTVAHQLRTPLAGIKWTIDMLVNGDIGKLNVDQNTMLFKIADSNDRMIRFVNDLLSLSRMESGRLEYNFALINLQHVVESVLLDLYPVANRKQITINFRGKGLALPDVLADKDKIRVVFQNLLENAVKYSPQGGRVTIELRNRGVEILASVIDEGIGIPKNEQKNIFNRFYRAPSAVKVESDGSGLGLFLAKNIVEGHKGKIWFESEAGKGTSFYFTIPVPKGSTV